MVNRVILIGNLGRDPEVRRLENGAVVARFSVATNESYKDKSGEWQTMTEWHEVVAWRNLGERAESQLKKGNQVYVEGKLSTRSWQDQDGNQRKTTEVVANSFRLLGARRDGTYDANFPSSDDEPAFANDYDKNDTGAKNSAAEEAPAMEADDDLPF
jgi:single-strand DNA-binding protein